MALLVTVGELVEHEGRGSGQRVMTAELLTKAASRMSALGERVAYAAMRSWLPGGEKAPAKSRKKSTKSAEPAADETAADDAEASGSSEPAEG